MAAAVGASQESRDNAILKNTLVEFMEAFEIENVYEKVRRNDDVVPYFVKELATMLYDEVKDESAKDVMMIPSGIRVSDQERDRLFNDYKDALKSIIDNFDDPEQNSEEADMFIESMFAFVAEQVYDMEFIIDCIVQKLVDSGKFKKEFVDPMKENNDFKTEMITVDVFEWIKSKNSRTIRNECFKEFREEYNMRIKNSFLYTILTIGVSNSIKLQKHLDEKVVEQYTKMEGGKKSPKSKSKRRSNRRSKVSNKIKRRYSKRRSSKKSHK